MMSRDDAAAAAALSMLLTSPSNSDSNAAATISCMGTAGAATTTAAAAAAGTNTVVALGSNHPPSARSAGFGDLLSANCYANAMMNAAANGSAGISGNAASVSAAGAHLKPHPLLCTPGQYVSISPSNTSSPAMAVAMAAQAQANKAGSKMHGLAQLAQYGQAQAQLMSMSKQMMGPGTGQTPARSSTSPAESMGAMALLAAATTSAATTAATTTLTSKSTDVATGRCTPQKRFLFSDVDVQHSSKRQRTQLHTHTLGVGLSSVLLQLAEAAEEQPKVYIPAVPSLIFA
jgi:hypothetical protein